MSNTGHGVKRRDFLKTSAAAASTLAVGTYLPRAWAAEPLRVSAYGGYFEDSLVEYVYPEFTKASGIEIDSVSQSGGLGWLINIDTAVKAGGAPPTDVTMTGGQGPLKLPHVFLGLRNALGNEALDEACVGLFRRLVPLPEGDVEQRPHLRAHDAGADAVHRDAFARHFLGQRVGEPHHRELGRAVMREGHGAEFAGDRRDIDDPPAVALRTHLDDRRLVHQERALGVHVHDVVPLRLAHLGDRASGNHAGRVDHDVDAAEAVHGACEHRIHGSRVRDIPIDGERIAADPGRHGLRRGMAAEVAAREATRGEAPFEIAAAKLIANQAAARATKACHQAHGAMGMTQEYPLHHFSRRLWSWRKEYGSDAHWSAVLGTMATGVGPDGRDRVQRLDQRLSLFYRRSGAGHVDHIRTEDLAGQLEG